MSDPAEVTRNDAAGRFEVRLDGLVGELTFRQVGDRLFLVHTGVPDAIAHRGVAGALTQAAFDYAEEHRLSVVPQCPYVRSWLEQHPEARDKVTVESL